METNSKLYFCPPLCELFFTLRKKKNCSRFRPVPSCPKFLASPAPPVLPRERQLPILVLRSRDEETLTSDDLQFRPLDLLFCLRFNNQRKCSVSQRNLLSKKFLFNFMVHHRLNKPRKDVGPNCFAEL